MFNLYTDSRTPKFINDLLHLSSIKIKCLIDLFSITVIVINGITHLPSKMNCVYQVVNANRRKRFYGPLKDNRLPEDPCNGL